MRSQEPVVRRSWAGGAGGSQEGGLPPSCRREFGFVMKLCILTFVYDPVSRQFDCPELEGFLAKCRVRSVYPQFVSHEGELIWAVLVTYQQLEPQPSSRAHRLRLEPEKLLDKRQLEVYDTLRRWRNERAKEVGKPAYVMFTNDMAVTITQKMPKTLTELEQVRGMGEGRLKEFGEELLGVIELGRQVATSEEIDVVEHGKSGAND